MKHLRFLTVARPTSMKRNNQITVFSLGIASLLFASCATTTSKTPDRFAAADTNHDGKLNRTEVAHYLASQTFESLDANHDGKLTLAEWNPTKNATDTRHFKAADTNHDGFVTLAEATTYVQKGGVVTRFMRDADTDKDGTVSHEEAKAYYASKEGPPVNDRRRN